MICPKTSFSRYNPYRDKWFESQFLGEKINCTFGETPGV